MEPNSTPEVPWKFPRLPQKFPGLSRRFPDFPGGRPLSLGSLTPFPDSQGLSLSYTPLKFDLSQQKGAEKPHKKKIKFLGTEVPRNFSDQCSLDFAYFLCLFSRRRAKSSQELCSWELFFLILGGFSPSELPAKGGKRKGVSGLKLPSRGFRAHGGYCNCNCSIANRGLMGH